MTDIVERLRAPAYWFSGSSEGHEGENNAPYEAAARIEQLEAALRDLADCKTFTDREYMIGIARAALDYHQMEGK